MADTGGQSVSVNTVLSRILTRSNQYFDSRPKPACFLSSPRRVHIDLPNPPSLLPALVAAGAKSEIAQAMQAVYHERACEFREQVLVTISRACSKLPQISSTVCSRTSDEVAIAALRQVYLKKLNSWVSEGVALLQEKGPSVLRCGGDTRPAKVKSTKTFNHLYTPLLEQLFEDNPFPTHSDKVFLAKKSGMAYRQIHVWFQNRRNRTKRSIHKRPIIEGATVPIHSPIRILEKFTVLPTEKSDALPSDRGTVVLASIEVCNVLEGAAPPHVFPTTYPPSCEYEPFPSFSTFTTPEWPRRPAFSFRRSCQSVMDVDELAEKFCRLSVWDDPAFRCRKKAGNMAYDGSAATSAITIKPYSAPHPACVRTTVTPLPPRMTLQIIPAPTPSLDVFRSPSPSSPMATLVPKLNHERKIAPLPKRIPSRPDSVFGREIYKSSVSSPSVIASSRSSSFSSDAPTQ